MKTRIWLFYLNLPNHGWELSGSTYSRGEMKQMKNHFRKFPYEYKIEKKTIKL